MNIPCCISCLIVISAAAASAAENAIACVDIGRVMRDSRYAEETDRLLGGKRTYLLERLRSRQRAGEAEIDALREEASFLKIGSPEWRVKMEAAATREIELRYELDALKEVSRVALVQVQMRFHEDLRAAVKIVAEKEGLLVALAIKDPSDVVETEDRLRILETDEILYSAPRIDITDKVIEAIDALPAPAEAAAPPEAATGLTGPAVPTAPTAPAGGAVLPGPEGAD